MLARIQEGGRTVRGFATAAMQATAEHWAWAQRDLLTGDALGSFYEQPPEMEVDYEFVPCANDLTNANVCIFRVNFTFGEILPFYPVPD